MLRQWCREAVLRAFTLRSQRSQVHLTGAKEVNNKYQTIKLTSLVTIQCKTNSVDAKVVHGDERGIWACRSAAGYLAWLHVPTRLDGQTLKIFNSSQHSRDVEEMCVAAFPVAFPLVLELSLSPPLPFCCHHKYECMHAKHLTLPAKEDKNLVVQGYQRVALGLV